MLSLGKMHINLALFHFKKDHSLVIIPLSVPAIFNPILSPAVNSCWHRRGCSSAGCCSLLVFPGIGMNPITWDCGVVLPHFQAFTESEVAGRGPAVQRLTLTFPRGNLAFPPRQPTLQGSLLLPAVSAGACSSTALEACGKMEWELQGAGGSWRGALLLLTINSFSYLLKKWVLRADIPIYLLISVPLTLNCRAPSCQLQLVISWVCVWWTLETFSSVKYRKAEQLPRTGNAAQNHMLVKAMSALLTSN